MPALMVQLLWRDVAHLTWSILVTGTASVQEGSPKLRVVVKLLPLAPTKLHKNCCPGDEEED